MIAEKNTPLSLRISAKTKPSGEPVCSRRLLNSKPGMTFLEIIIVVAIIAGLIAIVGPNIIQQFAGSQVDTAKIQMKSLEQALSIYRLDNGTYPDTEQGLKALLEKPEINQIPKNWKGPYLNQKQLPADPWGNPYIYEVQGSDQFTIKSLGSDNSEGGTGNATDILSTDF